MPQEFGQSFFHERSRPACNFGGPRLSRKRLLDRQSGTRRGCFAGARLFASFLSQHGSVEPSEGDVRVGGLVAECVDQCVPAVVVIHVDKTLFPLDQGQDVELASHGFAPPFLGRCSGDAVCLWRHLWISTPEWAKKKGKSKSGVPPAGRRAEGLGALIQLSQLCQ